MEVGVTGVQGPFIGEGGEKTAEQIRAAGGECIFRRTDVTDAMQVQRVIDEGAKRYGGIDILFSNVGVVIGHALVDVSVEEWALVMAINLKSIFLCSKALIPHMQKRGKGSIVLISSANGLMAQPCLTTYCTTKAAIIGLVRSIATDYGKDNIRANCLCPTYTRTPLMQKWIDSAVDSNLNWESVNRLHLLNRICEPNEVAKAVLFLATSDSSIVPGSALVADGGLTCFRLA